MRLSALVLLVLAPAFATAEIFTNKQGVSVEGEIVSADVSAGEVTVLVEKYRKEYPLKIADLAPESQALVQAWWDVRHPKPAGWVVPGAEKLLEFPDLPKCNHDGSAAACGVLIPANYSPDKPVPLIVWLTGGKGGNRVGGATALAGSEDFVCVSLPYPDFDGRDIFARQADGGLAEFWEYHQTMLDAVDKAIPNIDPRLRVIAGFSNGAHSIAGYFNQVDEKIASLFNVYVFGDGGAHNGDWQRRLFNDQYVYLCWGENSENKDMTLKTADAAEFAGMIVTRSEMKDTGHQFTPEEKEKVKAWLLGTVMPARLSEAQTP